MPPTEYQESRSAVRWKLLGAVVFVAFGVMFALDPGPFHRRFLPDDALRGIGVVVMLLFGLVALMGLSALRHTGPDLVVSDEAVTHRQWGRLEWREVRIIRTRSVNVAASTHRFIEVVPLDPDGFVSRLSPLMRLWAKANSMTGHSPFTVAESSLAVPFEQVLADLQGRHQRFLGF